jgi:Putative MetA-pathway of phenol degradation
MNIRLNLKLLLLLFILTLFRVKMFAQELITDRPDITESAVTVPTGDFQIEDGFLFENQSLENEGIKTIIRNYTISGALLRIGTLNKFEIRIGGDYLHRTSESDQIKTEASGLNNFLAGFKFQFTDEESNGQDLGMLLQFYLPVGSESFKPKNVEPEILLAYGKSLLQIFSLSANIGSHWNSYNENLIFLYSVSAGISINSKWDSFFEFYGDVSKDSKTSISFDFGLSYLLLNNLQFDISAGTESLSEFDDLFIGSGISIRLPD